MTRNNMRKYEEPDYVGFEFDDWDNARGHLGFEMLDDGSIEVDFYDNLDDDYSALFTLSKKEVRALAQLFLRSVAMRG